MSTTIMSQEDRQLAFDDLVHLMSSPSSAPQSVQDDSSPQLKSPSPEPLSESDIVQIHRKVTEMHHINKTDGQLTSREKELANMVLRLTAMTRPNSEQLLRQADLISALIQQRDLLLYQAEEQRLRWNSEKDGWARMVEALFALQAKNRIHSERDEDYERLHVVETDNKGLRQRLTETQSRLHLLESELTRLRPLLLMQPLISRSSMPPPTPSSKIHFSRRRKKDAVGTGDEVHGPSEDEPLVDPLDTPSHTSHSQATPRAKSRRTDAPSNVHPPTTSHKRRPSQKVTSRGLSADARAEHLLLAARKVGKYRAGIMSGMVRHLEERERERRREESATTAVAITPKTPRRNMSHVGYPSEGGYVYMNGQVRAAPGMQPVPLFLPGYPHLLQTPSSSTTAPSVTSSAQKSKQDAKTNNPPTPLDSLLSAARSMMREDIDVDVDEDEEVDVVSDSPGRTVGAHNARFRDTFGSPVPKRRKVSLRTDQPAKSHELSHRTTHNMSAPMATGGSNAGAGRVRSALDVLADQAAAFSTQEAPQSKGKGKEKADVPPPEPSGSTPKTRERTKSRRKEAEENTPACSVASRSRSRTPQSDSGDNSAGSTPVASAAELSLEALVDLGGGPSSANTSNPSSSQALSLTLALEEEEVAVNNATQSPRSQVTPSLPIDDPADVTPRPAPSIQGMLSKEGVPVAFASPSLVPPRAPSMVENEHPEGSPPRQLSEASLGGENDESSFSTPMTSAVSVRNKDLVRVTEQDVGATTPPAKRQRSPYVKWSKEEDDLLAQAVAKYGQKWDLVQKALPSRGYHQVRQRWLRKLGVFDSKPDLSSFQTAATTFPSASHGDGVEPRGNPKLGLAPLSSERAFSVIVGKSPPSMPL